MFENSFINVIVFKLYNMEHLFLVIVVIILLVLVCAFIFFKFFTSSWGVNWWTWLLCKPTGSMRGGCLFVIIVMAILLIGGYILGILS